LSADKKEKIRIFLKEFKKTATLRGIDFIPRQENQLTMAELGLTKKNCRDEIMSLSVNDYCEGPVEDRDKPGHVWIFGRVIEGREIYIKLKLAQVGKESIAKCLSFHAANFPLCFPLQDNRGGD